MHGAAKKGPLIGEATERTVGWLVGAALQGPYFLVLEEYARSPSLLPAALAFVSYGWVSVRVIPPHRGGGKNSGDAPWPLVAADNYSLANSLLCVVSGIKQLVPTRAITKAARNNQGNEGPAYGRGRSLKRRGLFMPRSTEYLDLPCLVIVA